MGDIESGGEELRQQSSLAQALDRHGGMDMTGADARRATA